MGAEVSRLSLCPKTSQRLLTSSPTMVCGELCHWPRGAQGQLMKGAGISIRNRDCRLPGADKKRG
jgi:hypothetical protein